MSFDATGGWDFHPNNENPNAAKPAKGNTTMGSDLQFAAIIVTVLLAVGGTFWTIMTTVNKGFAETRKEAKDEREKLRAEMRAGFAEAKEEREKGFAEAKEEREKGFAEAKEEREKGFAQARKEREMGFAEAKEEREKLRAEMRAGFAQEKEERQLGLTAAEKAREKGFAEAKAMWRDLKDEMNRRFDAVENRLARLEAPYFRRGSEDQGGMPVERVAEPRPLEAYPKRDREVESRSESGEGVGPRAAKD